METPDIANGSTCLALSSAHQPHNAAEPTHLVALSSASCSKPLSIAVDRTIGRTGIVAARAAHGVLERDIVRPIHAV